MSEMIYWEQQEGSMCAVHALNTLLQFPYWNPVSLAEIARELDRAENNLSTNWAFGNYNVREDGFYSVQAISKALQVHNLALEYFSSSVDPCSLNAFIFNSNLHWFTIRKIRGTWFNLNSMSAGPKIITEFNLQAMIGSLRQEGFTVFYVRGMIPVMSKPLIKDSKQFLLTVDQIRRMAEENSRARKEEERQMQEALRRSMQGSVEGASRASGNDFDRGFGGYGAYKRNYQGERRDMGSQIIAQQGLVNKEKGLDRAERRFERVEKVEFVDYSPEVCQQRLGEGVYEYSYIDGHDICYVYKVPSYSASERFDLGKGNGGGTGNVGLNRPVTVQTGRMQQFYNCTLSEEEQIKLALELSKEEV